MNTRLLSTFLALAMVSGIASAQIAVGTSASVDAKVKVGSSSVTAGAKAKANASTSSASSTQKKNDVAATTTARSNASATGTENRSTVANFVQSLLSIANREKGIGTQIRLIAQAQNDAASTSVSAMSKVEMRSKILTFLFGADYGSLAQLRTDMETAQANIEKLQMLANKATDANDKAELESQIKFLQDTQVNLDAFIKANESPFSLFGWLRKGQ